MPGAIAPGFHEGSRSEYLAQYVFSSWGTAVAVPHQEDHGLDLLCSLVSVVGHRAYATHSYTVQVKSEMDPWVFASNDDVRWLIENPLPLFLCVVNKKAARLSIYHTFARFAAWQSTERQERLELVPCISDGSECLPPEIKDQQVSLGQPILDFTIEQMLDNDFWQSISAVFRYWVELDTGNVTLIRTGVPKYGMPYKYKTNVIPQGMMRTWAMTPSETQWTRFMPHFKGCLEWVGDMLRSKCDVAGTTKAALLHRHLFRDNPGDMTLCYDAISRLLEPEHANNNLGLFHGVDEIAKVLEAYLNPLMPEKKPPEE